MAKPVPSIHVFALVFAFLVLITTAEAATSIRTDVCNAACSDSSAAVCIDKLRQATDDITRCAAEVIKLATFADVTSVIVSCAKAIGAVEGASITISKPKLEQCTNDYFPDNLPKLALCVKNGLTFTRVTTPPCSCSLLCEPST